MATTVRTPTHWNKRIREGAKPAYILIAELIAEDIHKGVLSVRDPLPTLRDLARDLGLNYTTVARGYAEARKRGLVDSHVGIGTVVRGSQPSVQLRTGTGAAMSMNLPPEPRAPELLAQLQQQACALFVPPSGQEPGLYDLLRYQDFGGTPEDRAVGALWLRSHLPQCDASQVLVAPGTHSVLLALMSMLARPGETVCVEALCYPGIKAIAAQLGLRLQALAMDEEGLLPEAFEHACKTMQPRALVCNPTIHNPSTATMGVARREALADVALRYSVPIVEDDAYTKLVSTPLPTLSSLAPQLTYYIGGLSKSVGAGLRVAYVHAPSQLLAQRLAGALRATVVMASPLAVALATRWIGSGLAERMVDAVRAESVWRQQLAHQYLADFGARAHAEGFHLWVPMPPGRNAVELAAAMRARGVSCVASVAFATDGAPAAAVRLCLGGHYAREELQQALRVLAANLDAVGCGERSAL